MAGGSWLRTSGNGVFEVGVDCPSTVTNLLVRAIGGGGGGGGAIRSGALIYTGGGGGAGGYFEDVITVTSISAINWEVGDGGAGMTFGTFGVADDGFDTVFGAGTAGGGHGGKCQSNNVDGGNGGAASGGSALVEGGPGGVGFVGFFVDDFVIFTGNGGIGVYGGGSTSATTFEPRGAPGSGGGAHATIDYSDIAMAGNGGMIIVTWFQ